MEPSVRPAKNGGRITETLLPECLLRDRSPFPLFNQGARGRYHSTVFGVEDQNQTVSGFGQRFGFAPENTSGESQLLLRACDPACSGCLLDGNDPHALAGQWRPGTGKTAYFFAADRKRRRGFRMGFAAIVALTRRSCRRSSRVIYEISHGPPQPSAG